MKMYIDESGSISKDVDIPMNKYFIIGCVFTKEPKKLKNRFKRFILKYKDELLKLKKSDKIFDKNKNFIELKGSALDRDMKIKFIEYFCKDNILEVNYIVLSNYDISIKFMENKARTFNYLLKLFLSCYLSKNNSFDRNLEINIDERNVRTESKFSLEDYLNQELVLDKSFLDKVEVSYFDSSQNIIIQIADVFSNIMYSNIITEGSYEEIINNKTKEKYISKTFKFPLNCNKN